MEAWESYYDRAVREGKVRDTPETRKGYKRAWDATGRQLGLRKEPKPLNDETAWLYD